MWDALWLFVAGFVCMVVFVATTVRADARAGRSTLPNWRGWLVLVLAIACITAGAVIVGTRLVFSD